MASKVKYVHVVVNPASGQPEPVLSTINSVFYPAGIKWDVSITAAGGDAKRFAQEAVARGADLVLAYGGDGTQMEVSQGLRDSDVPMGILPGGTANLLSVELGIPPKLVDAVKLAVDENSTTRSVDMGRVVVGEDTKYEFILRVGIGLEGKKIEKANREMKDKYGEFAYTIGGVQAMHESQVAKYHLVLDGKEYDVEGVNLLVTNAGTFGMKGMTRWDEISVSDGQLDVIVATSKGVKSMVAAAKDVLGKGESTETRPMGHAKKISIVADPPQPINGDGELWGNTPIEIEVIPAAVNVVVAASS